MLESGEPVVFVFVFFLLVFLILFSCSISAELSEFCLLSVSFLILFYLCCSLIGLCLDTLWMWFFQGGQFWLGVKENRLKRVYVGQKKAAVNIDVGFGDLLRVHLAHVHLLNSVIDYLFVFHRPGWLADEWGMDLFLKARELLCILALDFFFLPNQELSRRKQWGTVVTLLLARINFCFRKLLSVWEWCVNMLFSFFSSSFKQRV